MGLIFNKKMLRKRLSDLFLENDVPDPAYLIEEIIKIAEEECKRWKEDNYH